MAENKKSFINYCDWESVFSMLSDEEAGKLIKHIYAYVNDKNPVMEDRLLQMAFEPIKLSLKRDLKKYENVKEKRAEAGRIGGIKSGEARKQNIINEANKANASISKQKQANEAVSVNVNDSESVNDIKEEKNKIFKIEEVLKIALNDFRWVEANSTNRKELSEFNKKLEQEGFYEQNPMEYKTWFARWKRKGKKEIVNENKYQSSSAPLKRADQL